MKVLSLLVLLRAPMVVQRKDRGVALLAGQAQVDGGLAAVAADFQYRTARTGLQGVLVKGLGLVLGEEALEVVDIGGEIGNHWVNTVVRGLGKVAVLTA